MYDHRPNHQNRVAARVLACLFAISAVALVGAAFLPKYPVILQTVGVCMFVPIIQISVRFVLSKYLYRIKERESGGADLEIYLYRGGAKMQLVCRIGLDEIRAVLPLGKENARPPQGIKRYNYCPDLSPTQATVLSVRNGDGDCELLLYADARMLEIFSRAAADLTDPASQPED